VSRILTEFDLEDAADDEEEEVGAADVEELLL